MGRNKNGVREHYNVPLCKELMKNRKHDAKRMLYMKLRMHMDLL